MKTYQHGLTPFHMAIIKGNQAVLRFLVRMYQARDFIRENYQQGKHQRKGENSFE
jgi:hypothetical protein